MLPRGSLPVIALAIGLMVVPLASAHIGGFGYRVTTEDGTARFDLSTGGPQSLTFQDDDGDGSPDPGEEVWVSASSSSLQINDVRLTDGSGSAGSQIEADDSDEGSSVARVQGQLGFVDADSDGAFERGESLYWDYDDGSQGQVSANDIVLSGSGAGDAVGSSDSHLNSELTSANGAFKYHDTDGDGSYSNGDRVYLDVRNDGSVGAPDIRIGNPGPYAVGSMPAPGDSDTSLRLLTGSPPSNFVYVDDGGDGSFTGSEDPMFLSASTSTVFTGTIRLLNPTQGEPGSQVDSGETDRGLPLSSLNGDLSYADTGGGTDFGPGDTLIFDQSSGTQNSADGNDVVLSGPDAGQRVATTTAYQGASLSSAPGQIKYVDANGDGAYGTGDLVYLDAEGDGFVSAADVQLTDHQPADQPEPVDSDGDGIPDDDDACPDQPADTSDGCPEDTIDGDDGTDGTDDGSTDGGDSDSALQEAKEAQRDAEHAQQSAQEALDAANDAKRISEENSELIGQVLDKLNETGQNGSPGPGLVLALVGLAGAALVLRRHTGEP